MDGNDDEVIFYITLKRSIINEIETIAESDYSSKEVIIKKMIAIGLREFRKANGAKLYKEKRISITEAARLCNLTVKRMKEYLSEREYRLDYGIVDLEKELNLMEEYKSNIFKKKY